MPILLIKKNSARLATQVVRQRARRVRFVCLDCLSSMGKFVCNTPCKKRKHKGGTRYGCVK